jgi:hypothetical protein
MSVRYKVLPIIVIMVALLLTACGGPDAPEPTATPTPEEAAPPEGESPGVVSEPAGTAGACANPYFPVVLDANWSYKISDREFGPSAFTTTVSEVLADRFTLTADFDDLTITQQWECKPEGLVALELGGGAAAALVSGDTRVQLETSNISGVTIPRTISPGDEWTHSMDVVGEVTLGPGLSGTAEGQASAIYKAVGMEPVEVPAGSFEALRVDTEFTLELNVIAETLTMPVVFNSTGSIWYVPNTSWVLERSESSAFEMTLTETIELQTYAIP